MRWETSVFVAGMEETFSEESLVAEGKERKSMKEETVGFGHI